MQTDPIEKDVDGQQASASVLKPMQASHFYGRRKGRKLSQTQLAGFQRNLAEARIDLSQTVADESALQGCFSVPIHEIWLEIGFGGGEHLLGQLAQHPHIGMIGAEPFLNGVASTLANARQVGVLGRLRCYADDVMLLLGWLPRESVSRAFMLFPDPWPKKRHRSRRLFSNALLDKLLPALKPRAELRFASDILDYAEEAQGLAEARADLEVTQIFTSAERHERLDWPRTRYERKAERQGRSSTFLTMTRRVLEP